MKILSKLLIGSFLFVSPIALADHKGKDDQDDEEKVECELEDIVKDLTKDIRKFGDEIEATEWETETILVYLDELYDSAKKLKSKAKKYCDGGKKIKKYFEDVEENFELLTDELDEMVTDYRRYKEECKGDKSYRCKVAKKVSKSFEKLEDSFKDVEDEI